jgi:hypothetical protein
MSDDHAGGKDVRVRTGDLIGIAFLIAANSFVAGIQIGTYVVGGHHIGHLVAALAILVLGSLGSLAMWTNTRRR